MCTNEAIQSTYEIANQFRLDQLILLTESDLKISLASQIRKKVKKNITVNTESPWYNTYNANSVFFIDITAFDSNKLQLKYDSTTNRKGYKYDDEALVIELKFFKYHDDIPTVINDFNKMEFLTKADKNNCFIITAARTAELFEMAEKFMRERMQINRLKYNSRLRVYLFGPEKIVEII